MMEKIASLLLTVVLLAAMLTVFAVPASADDAPTSGKCGDELYWSISNDHTVLTFTGRGAMKDYGYYSNSVPWGDYRDTVTTINFPKEITHISKYAFCYFSQIERVWIPSDNVSLGYESFFGCENLIHMAIGTADGKLSDTITIGAECFEQCKKLRHVYISRALKTVEWDAFEQCYQLYYIDKRTGEIYLGNIYYGGTEQEYKDNVTVDMGDDNGNEHFIAANHHYRNDLWDASKWCYNDTECWHGLILPSEWYRVKPFDLDRADVSLLPPCENDGTKSWQILDGVVINEKTINWEYDGNGCRATLPDGTRLSGNFEWQSDGYKHWCVLPNGDVVNKGVHVRNGDVCTVCGSSDSTSVAYINRNGNLVKPSAKQVQITSDTLTLSGGEYVATDKVEISGRLEVNGDSTVILTDGCELNCSGGIHVKSGRTLTICSESLDPEFMGSLIAKTSKRDAAGIGSNFYDGSVHIVICGGKVTGKGGEYGAGIGAGSVCIGTATVDIYNGIVESTGGLWGAGIGSGYNGAGSCVNIYNGTVVAEGGLNGSGIGAGNSCPAAVYISSSAEVTAKGGDWASDVSDHSDGPVGNSFGFPKNETITDGKPIPVVVRPFEDGDYKIYSALGDRMCVDIDGSKGATNATDNVHLWSDSTAAYNVFTLTWDANAEAYSIKVKHSGLMLDVAGGSKGNGANIQQWGDNGTDAQRWVFEPAGNGYYYIRCKGGQYMDVAGLPNGTQPFDDVNIQSWSFIGAGSQKFKPVKVEASNNPTITGSILSFGYPWIAIAIPVLAIGGVAALIIVKKKKKKPALAGGADKTDGE